MSSDSEDDFSYTNTASMLKALKKDISLSEEKNVPLQVENSMRNEDFNSDVVVLDNLDDSHSPLKSSLSKLDVHIVEEVTNKNDSCIILSDEDLLNSPANLISKIDSVLVNEKRMTRSSSKKNSNTRGRGRRGRKSISSPCRTIRRSKRKSNNFEFLLANNMSTSRAVHNKPDTCIVDDNNDLQEGNYEVDVKVLWMSQYVKKFSIRRFDKVEPLFKYFSEKENIPENKLIFTIEKDAVILSKNDTPDSLNINAATIIEGGLRTDKNQSNVTSKQNKDCIEFKVQLKDKKRPLIITIRRIDRMEVLMHKTAAELNVDVKNLKFYFDGDLIKLNDSVHDLQLDGGECIDCIKVN